MNPVGSNNDISVCVQVQPLPTPSVQKSSEPSFCVHRLVLDPLDDSHIDPDEDYSAYVLQEQARAAKRKNCAEKNAEYSAF